VQDRIFTYLVSEGALVLRINSGAAIHDGPGEARRFVRFATWQILGRVLALAGVSDILACYRGRFVAVEVKAPGKGGNVSDAQRAFLEAVKRAGGVAIVADDVAAVADCLAAAYSNPCEPGDGAKAASIKLKF
jgi:hypothetical protein